MSAGHPIEHFWQSGYHPSKRLRAAPCRISSMAKSSSSALHKKSPRVSVTLSKDESSRLDALANQSNLARSWLGRYAIQRLLNAYEGGQLKLPLPSEYLNQ